MREGQGGAMIWTSEEPTKPGFYWYKDPRCAPTIFLLDRDDETGDMFLIEGGCWDFGELDGQWFGPLNPPQEQP